MDYINDFLEINPCIYHLTDGDYSSERDAHLHYGEGTFPLKGLLGMIPKEAKVTNEAKHDSNINLNDFVEDILYVKNI